MKKPIAYYLPQYHTFPENDLWWGKGFTEWSCVNNAPVPKIKEHRIKLPHPDIGYYSLLEKETRKKQAELAKKYKIYGFCYYHYWFGNKVLMQKPLELMLEDGEPDLPFCFCWANEPWTRRMNGGNGDILQPTNFGDEQEWEDHFQYLLKFFKNKNYILKNNSPVLVIYRVSIIKNYLDRFNYWRTRAKQFGFNGMHIIGIKGNFTYDTEKINNSVDAITEFYPNFSEPNFKIDNYNYYEMDKIYNKIINSKELHKTHYSSIMQGFDNSPRSPKQCKIFIKNSPELFKSAFKKILQKNSNDFVFINAWNEWGEGCVLEPETEDEYKYLEAISSAMNTIKLI